MRFQTIGELYLWLKKYEMCVLDSGSQGKCYKIGNKVYKIFLQFIDEIEEDEMITYDRDDIMQFSTITNNTYIFPSDVIMVGDVVIGYVTDYVDAISLYKTNPLVVDLDVFEKALEDTTKDIEIISNNGILSYDVTYNILYGVAGLKVIDTMEYSKTDMDSLLLFRENKKRFYYEIRLFLIDDFFYEFMKNNCDLYSMCYDPDVDIIEFLKEFRKRLSEKEGHEIVKLGDAKKSIVRTSYKNCKYIRGYEQY